MLGHKHERGALLGSWGLAKCRVPALNFKLRDPALTQPDARHISKNLGQLQDVWHIFKNLGQGPMNKDVLGQSCASRGTTERGRQAEDPEPSVDGSGSLDTGGRSCHAQSLVPKSPLTAHITLIWHCKNMALLALLASLFGSGPERDPEASPVWSSSPTWSSGQTQC